MTLKAVCNDCNVPMIAINDEQVECQICGIRYVTKEAKQMLEWQKQCDCDSEFHSNACLTKFGEI